MKKKLVIILFLFLFPLFLKAEEVNKIFISGVGEANVGSDIELSFNITYKGLDKKSNDGYGIGGYTYQLDFDDEVLVPKSIKSNEFFTTKLYKDENNKYHVIATINKDNKSKNKCNDNVLYCSDVKDTITFSVKQKKDSKALIKLFASSTYFYKIGSDLSDENKIINDTVQKVSKSIKISDKKAKSISTKNIATSIKSSNIEKTVKVALQDYKSFTDEKSNNNLSSLEIEGYDIVFDKHMLSYDINIPIDINSLGVSATCENENAKVEIEGNDDLKSNNYVVSVIVTAEDNSKKIYRINAILEKKEEVEEELETNEDIKNFVSSVKNKINDKTIKIIEIVGVSLLGLIVLVVIIKFITNRKLNKKLDNFDNL